MLSAWLLLALSSADLSDPDKGLSEEKEQALASPYAQLITSHFQFAPMYPLAGDMSKSLDQIPESILHPCTH